MQRAFSLGIMVMSVTSLALECPDLTIPYNGVIRCQTTENNLTCAATCLSGYKFQDTDQRAVIRKCDIANNDLLEGLVQIPDCIKTCQEQLMNLTMSERSPVLTATSSFSVDTDPEAALFSIEGAWRAREDNVGQYLQVDLTRECRLTGVVLQGDSNGNYVNLFRLLFSLDMRTWSYYLDDRFLIGNTDSHNPVTVWLESPQKARYVRVNPLLWEGHVTMNLDLLGCEDSEDGVAQITSSPPPGWSPCKIPPPPQNGAVSCERNGTHLLCTAFCLDNLVFNDLGPALVSTCDEVRGQESGDVHWNEMSGITSLQCVARESTFVPQVNVSQSCLLNATSCLNTGNGNYQYCGNCRYFATCSEKYFYVRACPVNLQYDMVRERCDYVSNTCQDDFTTRSTPRTTTVN